MSRLCALTARVRFPDRGAIVFNLSQPCLIFRDELRDSRANRQTRGQPSRVNRLQSSPSSDLSFWLFSYLVLRGGAREALSPNHKKGERRGSNPRDGGTTNLCLNHLATLAIPLMNITLLARVGAIQPSKLCR
jgi:hypothetical protein